MISYEQAVADQDICEGARDILDVLVPHSNGRRLNILALALASIVVAAPKESHAAILAELTERVWAMIIEEIGGEDG